MAQSPHLDELKSLDTQSPWQRGASFLKHLLREISRDRVGLIAAGCTYYMLLALFPGLTAFVSLYGLIESPAAVTDHVSFLVDILPESAVSIIQDELTRLAAAGSGSLSVGLIVGLAIAIWSANNGIKTLFQAMNVAHGVSEQRGFIKLQILTLSFTLGGLLLAIALIIGIGVVPILLALIGLGDSAEALIATLRWPLLLVLIFAGITVLYRFGPSGARSQWKAIVPGALLASGVWVAASMLFSWYLSSFANYGATYGSLGALIGALTWTWISMFILIVGAEFNAAIEDRKTVADVAPAEEGPRPRGLRKHPGKDQPVDEPSDIKTANEAELAGYLFGSDLRRRADRWKRRLAILGVGRKR